MNKINIEDVRNLDLEEQYNFASILKRLGYLDKSKEIFLSLSKDKNIEDSSLGGRN